MFLALLFYRLLLNTVADENTRQTKQQRRTTTSFLAVNHYTSQHISFLVAVAMLLETANDKVQLFPRTLQLKYTPIYYFMVVKDSAAEVHTNILLYGCQGLSS